jgi:hypothetical protein
VLDPGWRLGIWLGAIPVVYACAWWGGPVLGIGYPLLIAGCIFVTLTAINLVVVSMLPPFDRRAERLRDLVLPVAISLGVALVEIALAAQLRLFIDRLVGPLS